MRSLAKTIIYGDLDDLKKQLSREPPVNEINEIDEFGYSPLIETAIVNDTDKAALLIAAGADPAFSDLTGRTALHWAADAGNLSLCKLLLEKGADANAYTRAGQSVLVLPYLRKQDSLKKILYQYGANLAFAQDFVNAKLLGHAFSLEGRVDIVDPKGVFTEVEFEGFYLHFTLSLVHRSLSEFKKSYAAKHWHNLNKKLDLIVALLHGGAELMSLQHHLAEVKQQNLKVQHWLSLKPCLIPVGQAGHAISLIVLGRWLIRCDRGVYGRKHGTVIAYRMHQPERWNADLVKKLLYQRLSQDQVNEGLEQFLGLEPVVTLPLSAQISGNCSWANVEAVVPATLFLLLLKDSGKLDMHHLHQAKQIALLFYSEWLEWDKQRALSFCMQSMQYASLPRCVCKAAILGAVLFQNLLDRPEQDQKTCEKLLQILVKPQYQFILKSYIEVFGDLPYDKRYSRLISLLDDIGFDTDRW